jgi:hypothetical protein
MSEIVPSIGSKTAAKIIEIDSVRLYTMSSAFLSIVTHRAKYRDMIFAENIVFAKSYSAQEATRRDTLLCNFIFFSANSVIIS